MTVAKETITKRGLCRRIAERTGHRQAATELIAQMFLDEIIAELAKGNRLEFRNFGVFSTRRQPAREARNPRTNEAVEVPARAVVSFKVGRKMDALAQRALPVLMRELHDEGSG
jgi:integration host factor subunit beta